MTAPLAIALKKQGHTVTGSDQEKIYPPFSEQLEKAQIPVNQTAINSQINLAIIGSSYASFSKTKLEFEEIKNQNIPFISATKYLSENLIKNNSILVAGSYGKTTITAAVASLLINAKLDPSYMFGGQIIDELESFHFSNSNWSVIEADESINGLDTQAKFLYYPVKYLILTSANWEHKESYVSEKENFNAFKKLINNLPPEGLLIYNQNDPSILPLLKFSKCKNIPYKSTDLSNKLIGTYNQNNLGAAETLALNLDISKSIIASSFNTFSGIKRRLEICFKNKDYIFIDDFAQSSSRIKAALDAIKESYPSSNIKVFYENHASFMQYRSNLNELSSAFIKSTETVIYRLKYSANLDSNNRLIAKDYLQTIPNSIYIPLPDDVIKHYQDTLKPNDVLVHFSSGGSEGQEIFNKIINLYNK